MEKPVIEENDNSQDVGNIVFFDHINLEIPDITTAVTFYCEGLGMTRDPFKVSGNMWLNIGAQQFHLPLGEAQRMNGIIGLVVPDLGRLESDLKNISESLKHTQFQFYRVAAKERSASTATVAVFDFDHIGYTVDVICPWGNHFRIHQHQPKLVGYRGGFGIAYIELFCQHNSSAGIAKYYQEYLGALVSTGTGFSIVTMGPFQQFIFKEVEEKQIIPYDGHHVAIYIANFSSSLTKILKNGLMYLLKFPRNLH